MKPPLKYDLSVVIGRMQPFHKGHARIIREARRLAPRTVVGLGSYSDERTLKNPFNFWERSELIQAEFPGTFCVPIADDPDDKVWAINAVYAVDGIARQFVQDRHPKNILVGHNKEGESRIQALFPCWDFKDAGSTGKINATSIREAYFGVSGPYDAEEFMEAMARIQLKIHDHTYGFLNEFFGSQDYVELNRAFHQ